MQRFKNIMCVLTRRGDQGCVLARSVNLGESNQARLRVVTVAEKISVGMGIPEGGPISEELQNGLLRDSEELLENAVRPFRDRVDIETRVLVGTPFLEVIREVLSSKHDLVVKTAEDPEWLDRLFGSDDMHLLRKCPCPVWLLKPGAPTRFRNILAAVDVDDDQHLQELEVQQALNDQVLQLSASLAAAEQARLHVGHAWDAIDAGSLRGRLLRSFDMHLDHYNEAVRQYRQENLDRLLQRLTPDLRSVSLEIQMQLVKGAPREVIPSLANAVDADLVVMGTVARTGIPGFIVGNTAEMILSQVNCSVLAVKPPGFTSPIVSQSLQ
jgi:nucleotide-binding universal stress UspA family protein